MKIKYESNKTRYQLNKLRFAKLYKTYKKTCEKIEKLKIIVENQQKKIENFVIKKNKQKQSIFRVFVNSKKKYKRHY